MRSGMTRSRSIAQLGVVLGLIAGSLLVGSPSVDAASVSTCRVRNATSGAAASGNLQAAIFAARPGSTIVIRGVCLGGFRVAKDMEFVGKATDEKPVPSLDGEGLVPVLVVHGDRNVHVSITDLTLTHGFSTFDGGGIVNEGPVVTLAGHTVVTANHTEGVGGGIFNAGPLRLLGRSTVSNNTADEDGGGIFTYARTTLFDRAKVVGNSAGLTGAGIASFHGRVAINDDGAVAQNSGSVIGGGIYAEGNPVLISGDASVDGNSATTLGGGIYGAYSSTTITIGNTASVVNNQASTSGGGVYLDEADLTLNQHVRVSQNSSGQYGGGIYNYQGAVVLNDSVLVNLNTSVVGGGLYNLGGTVAPQRPRSHHRQRPRRLHRLLALLGQESHWSSPARRPPVTWHKRVGDNAPLTPFQISLPRNTLRLNRHVPCHGNGTLMPPGVFDG